MVSSIMPKKAKPKVFVVKVDIPQDQRQHLAWAANAANISIEDFVIEAARARAIRVLAKKDPPRR